uniref:Uncharacterized protein n=1 Tax=Erpetoichthys calabaricus TaxID=27687 RepID=A0A8C4SJG1_ERPCA
MAPLIAVLLCFSFPLSTALVTLTFPLGITTSVQFDFCSIINCGTGRQAQWTGSDKYVCMRGSDCDNWQWVFANTGTEDWGYQPFEAQKYGLKNRFSIIKGHASHECADNHCNPLIITLKNPSLHDSGIYVLGAYVSGTDPLGRFLIKIDNPVINTPHSLAHTPISPTFGSDFSPVKIMNISTLSSTFSVETGYGDQNRWLQWVLYSAKQVNRSHCYACAAARPHLATVPFPLSNISDPVGLPCLLYLFTTSKKPLSSSKCSNLSILFPPTRHMDTPMFQTHEGNYTCFKSYGTTWVGELPFSFCSQTFQVNFSLNTVLSSFLLSQTTPRSDIWWMCSRSKLFATLPPNWSGTCAPIQLVMPFRLLSLPPSHSPYYSTPPFYFRHTRSLFHTPTNISLHG